MLAFFSLMLSCQVYGRTASMPCPICRHPTAVPSAHSCAVLPPICCLSVEGDMLPSSLLYYPT